MVDCTDANNERKLVGVRELSDEEVAQLELALSLVGAFNGSYSLYEICAANYAEFNKYYTSLREKRGVNLQSAHEILIEGNRLLLNFLSSFRTFIDHQESDLKKISTADENWLEHFKQQAATLYDNTFSYRFLWNLRNYVQHCGLPVGGFAVRPIKDNNGEEKPYSSMYFSRDSLLSEREVWKKIVREELAQQPEEIDIGEHIDTLWDCIGELATSAWEIHIHRMSNSWEFLVGIVNEALAQQGAPCIGEWETIDDKHRIKGVSPLPMHTIMQIQEIWTFTQKTGQGENVRFDKARIIAKITIRSVNKMAKHYTPKFKFQVVLEVLQDKKSPAQVAKAYGVHPNTINNWKQLFLDNGADLFAHNGQAAEYERQIAKLEQLLGKKEIELALLKNFLGQSN